MDYKALSNDFIDVVVEALYGFEQFDKHGPSLNYTDVQHRRNAAMGRYRSDPVFHAKVQSLVGRLTDCVWRNTNPMKKEPRIECGATGGPGPGGDDNCADPRII